MIEFDESVELYFSLAFSTLNESLIIDNGDDYNDLLVMIFIIIILS